MNEILGHIVIYTIEFLKAYLLTSLFMEYKKRSQVLVVYICTMVLFVIITKLNLFNESPVQIILLVISLMSLSKSPVRRSVPTIIIAWMSVSVIDMFLGVFLILITGMTADTFLIRSLTAPWNAITLIGIYIFVILYRRKNGNRLILLSGKYMLFYFIGILMLSIYLTVTLDIALGELTQDNKTYVVVVLNLLSVILIMAFMLLLFNATKNDRLTEENYMRDSLLESQKNYYTMRLQKENETRAFRHDIINHLYCMDVLLDEGKHEELKRYLADIIGETGNLKLSVNTGNDLVTAIVQDIIERYEGVDILWNGALADNEMLSQMDICTIFYNLLKNAAEGVENRDNKNIEVSIKKVKAGTKIVIVNEADEPLSEHGRFLSHKKEAGHGYGLSNVIRCVEKNQGEFHADYENGFFHVEIILPSYEK